MNHLVWFRNDLRLCDQPTISSAILSAKSSNSKIIACYIDCPKQWSMHHMAPIRHDFILARVKQLQSELKDLNISFLIKSVDTYDDVSQCLSEICTAHQISDLYFNEELMIYELQRDQKVIDTLCDVKVHKFYSDCLIRPNTIFTQQNNPFKVFTYFKKEWLKQLPTVDLILKPKALNPDNLISNKCNLDVDFDESITKMYPVDEASILQTLRDFVQQKVSSYEQSRDYPSLQGTSKLSPYLAIGALSPKQCLMRLFYEFPNVLNELKTGPMVWLSELIWREFYKSTLVSFPNTMKGKAFLDHFENLQFLNNRALFDKWCIGQTGYPIVDAAMRQLNQTGWMHNRLRMVTASFLIKDLHIDWRWGEKYFMQKLIDGDYAANNGGWQWAASTGTDAAPYFRIFNPTTQGERFDKSGKFIKQFIPELKDIPSKFIHKPHDFATKNSIELDYPKPIVDHKVARLHTLDMYKEAKSQYLSLNPKS
ncbi:MAG: deoxyribodipyrimidine photo-lyase [Candidatus Cloacimonetes bacterium]|nr:deoxyribodipyrimidine photo-lyase [Candidatus Cloacimonadota bacterium]